MRLRFTTLRATPLGLSRIIRRFCLLHLNGEWDADIVAWIEAQPRVQRSEIVRAALRKAMQPETSTIDPEDFRYMIADELEKALSSLRVQSLALASTTASNNDAEAKYGKKLDRKLGNLGRR